MTTKAAPAKVPTGGFTYKLNPHTGKWHVFEDGKFRQPFDSEQDARNFIAGEIARKAKKERPHT